MRITPLVLAFMLAAAVPAGAEDFGPQTLAVKGAHSVELGTFRGVAYYTEEPDGYRVVATFANGEDQAPMRFVALLSDKQKVSFSVPASEGKMPATVEIARDGGRVIVTRPDNTGF